MICPRPWIALLLAGVALGGTVAAQQSSGGSSGSSGNSGGAAPSGSSSSDPGPTPAAETAKPAATSDAGAASSFGTPAGGTPGAAPASGATPPAGTGTGTGTGAGAGGGPGGSTETESAPTFTVPLGGGRPADVLRYGQGRLARPRFRFTGSVALGFDDNIFGTPTKQQEIPDREVQILVSQGTPDRLVLVRNPRRATFKGGLVQRTPEFHTERIRGMPPVFRTMTIPGFKPEPRQASVVAQANVRSEVTFATRRTAFTLDLRLGTDYAQARSRDPLLYTGALGARFAHKLLPRLQWDASVDATYGTQPDLARVNSPTNVTTGSYLNLAARTGLAYRWSPRISSSASVAYASLKFSDNAEQSNDYDGLTFSLESSYLFNPRFTVIGEFRHTSIAYAFDSTRDSATSYALLGVNWKLSRRTQATGRLGATLREADTGETALSPYLEFAINYQLGRASVLQWNGTYGFEEPSSATSKVLTLRTGLNYTHFFTPRLRATAGANILYSTTSNISGEGDSSTQLLYDTSLGFQYTLTRRWTLTGTYSFTTLFSENEFAEYYRNRFFIGAGCQF